MSNLIDSTIKDMDGNLSKVARVLGIDYFALKDREAQKMVPTSYPVPSSPRPVDIKTLGREHARRYVIAVRPRGALWSPQDRNVLNDARRKFDAGTHEMFQTTEPTGWVVQYLIPRLVPTKPRRFFHTLEE